MSPYTTDMPTGAAGRPRRRRWRFSRTGDAGTRLARFFVILAPLLAASVLAIARPPSANADALCPAAFGAMAEARGLDAAGDVRLADGRTLRLAALADISAAPDPARRSALEALVAGKPLALATADAAPDRYGRVTALARLPDGTLVQEEALRRGLAVARPEAGYLGCLPALLVAERPARAARLGVWSHLPVRAEPPQALAAQAGHFSVVQGRVRSVGSTRRLDYLNFGPVWRQDTTVRIEAAARDAMALRGAAVSDLEGREVLVRGEVDLADGPVIDVQWAEQVEALAAGVSKPRAQ